MASRCPLSTWVVSRCTLGTRAARHARACRHKQPLVLAYIRVCSHGWSVPGWSFAMLRQSLREACATMSRHSIMVSCACCLIMRMARACFSAGDGVRRARKRCLRHHVVEQWLALHISFVLLLPLLASCRQQYVEGCPLSTRVDGRCTAGTRAEAAEARPPSERRQSRAEDGGAQ